MRAPYILYQRKSSASSGKMYNVGFWDSDKLDYSIRRSISVLLEELGEHAPPASPTSKSGARIIVEAWMKKNTSVIKKSSSLIDYLEEFWKDDGDYARGLRARGRSISTAYLANNRRSISRYAKTYFENQSKIPTLENASAALLEGLVMHLHDKGVLSSRTINTIRQAIAVPLGEAFRLGKIEKNPAISVAKLAEVVAPMEILSLDEVKRFFKYPWSDPRLYAVNLLAATTGLRLGECRGLLLEDIRGDYIHLSHNWQDSEGLKAPKWGSMRDVPLPAKTAEILKKIAETNPWGNGFVFFGLSEERPISKKAVEEEFNLAIESLGMTPDERKLRRLTFHSWRHWYNSMLRGQVSDHALRALTGHRSEAMTDRYTEIPEQTRAVIVGLADSLV